MSEVIRYDPGQCVARIGWEPSPGIAYPASYHDFVVKGEKLGAKAELVERDAMSRNALRLPPLIGKLMPGGELEFDALSARESWPFWALMLSNTDDPTSGAGTVATGESAVYQHKIHRLGANAFPDTAAIRVDRNDGFPTPYSQCRTNQFAIKGGSKQHVSATFSAIVGASDYWGDVVPTGGNTGTMSPFINGINGINFSGVAFYAKVTALTSSTVTIETKRGSGATYGTAYTINRGQWVTVLDENGVPMGQFTGLPTQMYFPLPGGTNFAVGDEFHFPPTEPDWLDSYTLPPISVIAEVYSYIIVDGVQIEIDSTEITIKKPAESKYGFGGRQPTRTRTRGIQTVEGKITRERQPGFSFQEGLILGQPFTLVLELHSGVQIGTTGLYDRSIKLVMDNILCKGQTATAESNTKMDEAVDFSATQLPGDPFPADITAILTDDIPNLLLTDGIA